ncbi:MAG: hypothetical protein WBA74_12605, partial [Cyclobacteriaceae bacterium]
LLGLQEKLPADLEKEEKDLLDSIIADLQEIQKNEEEIEKLNESNINRQKEINDLKADITLNNAKIQIYLVQLDEIPAEIINLDREIAHYQEANESDENVLHFEAVNEHGDFTNNYGEPLVPGIKYTAMVFSVIKPTHSEVAPQYKSVYSKFSSPQVFKGLQINN